MKMIQRLVPDSSKTVEVFYDGQLRIQQPEGIVEFTRPHWRDVLYQRGYRDLPDESEVSPTSPKRRTTRKVKDNDE